MNEIATPDDDAAPAFDGLRAMFVNCTLKKSPERSHSQGLADISRALFEKHGVAVDEIRAIDHDIATGVYPDMTEHGWDTDDWPALYERIIAAEESFLLEKFGEPYREWSAQTPVFWPRLRNWRRPDMPFSLRTVIRREHVSALGGFVVLYLLELGLHTLPGATDTIAPGWHWLMGLAIVLEIVARVAKPAGWLKVEGR